MKRFLLCLGTLAFLAQFVGCGESSAPAVGTKNPEEAKAIEKRRAEEREGSTEPVKP